jgi:uncharacterized cupredoxin-like copper-binding protein
MTDFEFTPAAFTVPAGEEVELHVKHDGTVEHDLIIMKYGTDAGHSFEEEDEGNVYWSRAFQPGASETATLTAPSQPGVYQVICGIRGHLEAGMVGSLTVVGP